MSKLLSSSGARSIIIFWPSGRAECGIDKDVKLGRIEEAVFQLFSRGLETGRDEWVYDFQKQDLVNKTHYLIEVYQTHINDDVKPISDIKWDRELDRYLAKKIHKEFDSRKIRTATYRPFTQKFIYFDRHFNRMPGQIPAIFPGVQQENLVICCTDAGSQKPFMTIVSDTVPDLHVVGAACSAQCLPFYRYDKEGTRIDNITDWGLTKFQTHYSDPKITKENIFHYTYAVLHHPAYRTKYEINLKREFPRLPFYPDFHQWATWGQTLMALHLNYETIEPYGLTRTDRQYKTAKSK